MDDPFLNAIRLIEKFSRDLAVEIGRAESEAGYVAGANDALSAVVMYAEKQRALLECAGQRRLN